MWYTISFVAGLLFGLITFALLFASRIDEYDRRLYEEDALRQTMNSEPGVWQVPCNCGTNSTAECPVHPENIIEDGFGSQWSKTCPECGEDTMVVTRPGKAQCMECG